MAKKVKNFRLSDEDIAFIQSQKPDGSLTEALETLLTRLRYLEDLALQQNQPNPQDTSQTPMTDLEFAEQHSCVYRTFLNDNKEVLCMENKKIPLSACITRQKRYVLFKKRCRPIGLPKPQKHWKDKLPPKTRIYRDEFEQAYYPDGDNKFRDDWGQQT